MEFIGFGETAYRNLGGVHSLNKQTVIIALSLLSKKQLVFLTLCSKEIIKATEKRGAARDVF